MGKLNERQSKFCREYFKDPSNASEAARRAGYSAHTCRSQGGRLLLHGDIQAELARMRKKADDAEYGNTAFNIGS